MTQACTDLAQAPLDSDPRLIDATRYAKNRAFNAAFSRCMTERMATRRGPITKIGCRPWDAGVTPPSVNDR